MDSSIDEIRVLYIHSNVKYAGKLASSFERAKGISVRLQHAPSLAEGLEILANDRPDVILAELDLPDSLGLDTCRRICATAPDLPLVVVAANEDFDLARSVVRLGADAYFLRTMATYPAIVYHICCALERSRRQARLLAAASSPQLPGESKGDEAVVRGIGGEDASEREEVVSGADAAAGNGAPADADPDVKRVLIVDDDEIARDVLTECLGGKGFVTEEVSNGYEALVSLRAHFLQGTSFDLVLLDLMMPEMNGFEFLHTVRQRKWGKGVPILVSTAKNDRGSVERCKPYNISGYVVKPFEPDVVLERVSEALSEDKTRRRRVMKG